MSEFDNKGKISLWKNESSDDKHPIFKGQFYAHRDIKTGEKISVALWRNTSDNPKAPSLSGRISNPFETPSTVVNNEDIPF